MSSELADSLADSMDAMEFVCDNFESGPQELEEIKKEVTIQTVVPDFSQARVKGEKPLSSTVLTTSFDDDVKKYAVFEIPQDESDFKTMCGRPIGSGNTFCINTRCRIRAHEGVKRAKIPQGQLYVLRNKSSIFAVPNIASFALAESIVEEWKEKSQTLDTWNHRFRTARNNLEDADSGFVTSEAFYRDEEVNKLA